jgi:hypothetical protein
MNRWLRLSVFSAVGIIISMVLLSFVAPQQSKVLKPSAKLGVFDFINYLVIV